MTSWKAPLALILRLLPVDHRRSTCIDCHFSISIVVTSAVRVRKWKYFKRINEAFWLYYLNLLELELFLQDKNLDFPAYIRVVSDHRWSMLLSMLRIAVRAVCYNWGARPGANSVASITTLQYNLVPSYTRSQRLTQFAPGEGVGVCWTPFTVVHHPTRPSHPPLLFGPLTRLGNSVFLIRLQNECVLCKRGDLFFQGLPAQK